MSKGGIPMSIVESTKVIYELAKKGMTIELREKLMELREEAVDMQEEIVTLRKRVLELEEKLAKQNELLFEDGLYWLKKDDGTKEGPFCQKCHDADGKMVRLSKGMTGGYGSEWNCTVCHGGFGKYK